MEQLLLKSNHLAEMATVDECIVHLARALLVSPHVLVLHKPFAALDEDIKRRFMATLRMFVTERGALRGRGRGRGSVRPCVGA